MALRDVECIGDSNKEHINNLNLRMQLLEKEVEHVKENMVKASTLHELQLQISEIKLSIQGIMDDREYDREQISKLTHTIEHISSTLEESFQDNANVLANQKIYKQEQKRFKEKQDEFSESLNDLIKEVKTMNQKIEDGKFMKQIKRIWEKSKLHKAILIFAMAMIFIFGTSIFLFFTTGGSSFFDILGKIFEGLKWIGDILS